MTDELSGAIAAVKQNHYSFCKFISANDAGATGAHQAGLYIPKNSVKLLFDEPGEAGSNKERFARIDWFDGTISNCRFIYYGQGTRNEYRATRLGQRFVEGEFVVIVKVSEEQFRGFLLRGDEPYSFLAALNLTEEQTNQLITNDHHGEDQVSAVPENPPAPEDSMGNRISFRPKAHILILLGEELIKSPVMAIYELIKNSYDADATRVSVTFNDIDDADNASIEILDNGTGMTAEILQNVWFEPGTDFRKPYDDRGKRQIAKTAGYSRIPMGEKGVGRFAVHKLGNKITLVSRPSVIRGRRPDGRPVFELLDYEIAVSIDWRKFSRSRYLDDVSLNWQKNTNPETFYFKEAPGTLIRVSNLKESWSRAMARQLKRQTLSMLSPQNDAGKFTIDLDFKNWWLHNMPEARDILNQAPYKLTVFVDSAYNMTFDYRFALSNNRKLGDHIINDQATDPIDAGKYEANIKGRLKPFFRDYLLKKEYEPHVIDEQILNEFDDSELPFGSLLLEMYSYDLDGPSMRDYTGTPKIIRDFLKEQAGIRVFKGDLRVYDYGDPGNDWLGLDIKRVNNKEWFSNNQNVGYIYLDAETSGLLIETTNREGFIHNNAYEHFIVVLDYILTEFKAERQSDREQWLAFNKKGNAGNAFSDRISGFKKLIGDTPLDDEAKQKLLGEAERIEEQYEEERSNLLIPAGVGMTASFAMHEIEKLVPRMLETVRQNPVNRPTIVSQVDELRDYVEGILSVLKKGGNTVIPLVDTIEQAISNYASRLRGRHIEVVRNYDDKALQIVCDKRLLITMIMNLIDNSIYWLDTIFSVHKSIFIGIYQEEKGISILIVDNGPGFREKTEDIIRPFYTRKQNGIGIGMYLVDTIMIQYGLLTIIRDRDLLIGKGVPSEYNGAAVQLTFSKLQ
jgi:signal transduction histidine kinase